ncbi:hypothetical protein ACFPME_09310 [Rhodanobacter umsongensis]|uniref:DUF3619 domain-containing protein n=1 Tax=Rhodanobacter umsongensis TaxID=633153 RepID=A0ABW0JLZ8_9GAMM
MNSSDNRPGQPAEQRARELWHEAAQRIDPATVERLRAARRRALHPPPAPAHRTARWLIPTGAFAVIVLATLMVWRPPHPSARPAQASSATDAGGEFDNELPPDADKADPNLYQNLDFYGWLAASNRRPASR